MACPYMNFQWVTASENARFQFFHSFSAEEGSISLWNGHVDAARNRFDNRPHDPPGTLAAHYSDCFCHVHHRLYRPDQHLHGSALDEPGIAHDPHPGWRRSRGLLLGLSVAANSRWLPGRALERQALRERASGCMGNLLGSLRSGTHREAILGDAFASGGYRGRRVAGDPGAAGPLVSPRRARPRQRLLDAVPAGRCDPCLAALGLDSGPLGLARAAHL